MHRNHRLAVLGPLVLAADLVFLLWGEVVLDVERLANLLWRLALDHVGNSLAPHVEQSLDIHVVCREDDLKEHLLVDLHELLVPVLDIGRLLSRVGVVVLRRSGVVLVVLAPLKDLAENSLGDLSRSQSAASSKAGADARVKWWIVGSAMTYVHDGNGLFAWRTEILDHVLDEHGALSNLACCAECQYGTRLGWP